MSPDIILGVILIAFSVLGVTGLTLASRSLINRISRLEKSSVRDIRQQLNGQS